MKQKPKTLGELVMEAREELSRRHPACFGAKGTEKKPLAVGVKQAAIVRNPDLPPRMIAFAINNYVRGKKYQTFCTEGAIRVDLDGNPASVVTAEQAKYHARTLEYLEQRWAERDAKKVKAA